MSQIGIIEIHIIKRAIDAVALYDGSNHPGVYAEELVVSARPVLLVCAYDGPDVSELYASLDAIDIAIGRASEYVALDLQRARRTEIEQLARTISRILRTARAQAEQAHDVAAAPQGGVTHLETRLRASVAGR